MTVGSAIEDHSMTATMMTMTTSIPADDGETALSAYPLKSIEEGGGTQTIDDGTTGTGIGNVEGAMPAAAAAAAVVRRTDRAGPAVHARRCRHSGTHSTLTPTPRQSKRGANLPAPLPARKKNPTSPTPAPSPRKPTR